MNIASWIILAILVIWVILAVRASFFKGKHANHASKPKDDPLSVDDDKYKIEISSCGGCDKSSCSDCPLARGDIPMPTIRELK